MPRFNRRGTAMTELSLLAPVYVLLLVGLIYFGNCILMWQEVQLAARFLSMNTRSGASGSGGPAMIAHTSGSNVPEDYFIYLSGTPRISVSSAAGDFSQQQIRDELIKASWNVSQDFDVNGNSFETAVSTLAFRVVYAEDPPRYAFDGDDALIASELTGWFNRKSASVSLTHDSNFLRVGKWKLPNPTVTAEARAVVREEGCDERSLTESAKGFRKPIEDILSEFADGPVPLPDYPAFGESDEFWEPN